MGYSRDAALAALDAEGLLPDMLNYNPTKSGAYPNGRRLTDHIIANRLHMLSNVKIPPDGLKPHTDLLTTFPYLGTPHATPTRRLRREARRVRPTACSASRFDSVGWRRSLGAGRAVAWRSAARCTGGGGWTCPWPQSPALIDQIWRP